MLNSYKKKRKSFLIGLVWFFCLLWPLTGIHEDGTITFKASVEAFLYIAAGASGFFALYIINKKGILDPLKKSVRDAGTGVSKALASLPRWTRFLAIFIAAMLFPFFADRYSQDIAINVLVYICLGLGLNIVVGLAGMLDLGYIAFYGVGAYAYALLSIHWHIPFFMALPLAGLAACIAGCIIGYPTLRMRGDYLAIVTLGFGEIVRNILNNWMSLTKGPNGLLGIAPPALPYPDFTHGLSLKILYMKNPQFLYFVILIICVFTVIAVYRLNHSRIGRAWEAIREDETVAEMMGVDTFLLKLLAYAMGAVFGGLAGAFFAARMRFVSPESFSFMESAMVLAMVVLGGMGSIPGIILGTFALVVLPEAFREVELYRMLVFGAAMIVMMLFKPEGLIPNKRPGPNT